jgi:glycosyltransferase involved in cell wall biosynthesis
MKLGYVSALFPFAPAEQFLEPEVRSLAGWFDVVLVSTRATVDRNAYPALPATAVFLGVLDRRVRELAWREIRRSPGAVAACLATLLFARSSLRARVVNLILFPKALALAQESRRLGLEHLHVNWLTSSATIVYVASRLTGIPFSMTGHQHDIFFDNLLLPKVRAAEFVRVISERNARHVRERLPAELRAKCRVVHLGVDVPSLRLARAGFDEAAAPAQTAVRIVCAARLCRWKGHRYLLAALALLRDRGVAFTCDFAGDGEERRRVTQAIRRHRLGDRVQLLGNLPHAELVARLDAGAYDVAVLASTEDGDEHEGIPVALMEAMAAAIPVVATATGSIPELVDEGCGLLVPQRDPAALAAALERLISAPAERAALGRAGRRRVAERFSTVTTTRDLAELLCASAPWRQEAGSGDRGQKSHA